jgi:hypothetical protein
MTKGEARSVEEVKSVAVKYMGGTGCTSAARKLGETGFLFQFRSRLACRLRGESGSKLPVMLILTIYDSGDTNTGFTGLT